MKNINVMTSWNQISRFMVDHGISKIGNYSGMPVSFTPPPHNPVPQILTILGTPSSPGTKASDLSSTRSHFHTMRSLCPRYSLPGRQTSRYYGLDFRIHGIDWPINPVGRSRMSILPDLDSWRAVMGVGVGRKRNSRL